MHTLLSLDTLRRIAREPIATADLWGPIVVPAIAIVLLLAARQYLGRWPDLWRFRRRVLPVVADVGDGEYEDLDERVDAVDLEETIPEKTELPLQDIEFAGTIDAPPSVIRQELRDMERVWPAWLASIQYELVDGEPVYEVGSYAYRPDGFVGKWQLHMRLTPRDGGRQTALWVHWELNPWARPVGHYKAKGWDADRGIREVASLFASDDRYQSSDRAVELIGQAETPS